MKKQNLHFKGQNIFLAALMVVVGFFAVVFTSAFFNGEINLGGLILSYAIILFFSIGSLLGKKVWYDFDNLYVKKRNEEIIISLDKILKIEKSFFISLLIIYFTEDTVFGRSIFIIEDTRGTNDSKRVQKFKKLMHKKFPENKSFCPPPKNKLEKFLEK